jgi:hypothetical protein
MLHLFSFSSIFQVDIEVRMTWVFLCEPALTNLWTSKYVRLTTHNIACRHHRPMSRFVSAEDTALQFYPITYPSQLFPVRFSLHTMYYPDSRSHSLVLILRQACSTCGRPYQKQVLVLRIRFIPCLSVSLNAYLVFFAPDLLFGVGSGFTIGVSSTG